MQKEEVARGRLKVPKQHIVIAEVKHSEAIQRVAFGYGPELDPEGEGGMPIEGIATLFHDRQCFVLHLPYEAGDGYRVPLTVFYRMQNLGPIRKISNLYEEHWNARKKDFEASFLQAVEKFARGNSRGFFSDMEQSGELVRLAKIAGSNCNWSAVVVGVGRVHSPESDPFTHKAE